MNKKSFFNKKSIKLSAFILTAFITFSPLANAQYFTNLPTTEILGKNYYIYETQKGESLYGIAKRFGWDIEELARINPDSGGNFRKGRRIYYPVDFQAPEKPENETFVAEGAEVIESPEITAIEEEIQKPELVEHKVKKGESLYGISRQYGISLDEIYAVNPNAKHGIKTGETLIIPQSDTSKYTYYTVKSGDTLYSTAKRFNTSIEDILKQNPGLTEKNFMAGETIRIIPDTKQPVKELVTEHYSEDRVKEISGYKVEKDDTWSTVSEKTGVDEQLLKDANSGTAELKKNQVINVPKVETVEVEKQYEKDVEPDVAEIDIQDIYDNVHKTPLEGDILETIKVALILDDPKSKKDIDFTRGFLVYLKERKHEGSKIELKVIDGRVATNELTDTIEYFEPTVIISTADKAFPAFLADYGNTNNVEIINVFDLRNDLYEDNHSMIQFLLPTSFFSESIAEYIHNDNRDKKLILAGEPEKNDALSEKLMEFYSEDSEIVPADKFKDYKIKKDDRLLMYSSASQKEDVSAFLQQIKKMKEATPTAEILVVGRPHWALLIDGLQEEMSGINIVVPARSWLDESTEGWNNFITKYNELFQTNPSKTIPNYAASGYDIATYFLPLISKNGGDFNVQVEMDNVPLLQSNIDLERINKWGGLINMNSYLLKVGKEGNVEKVLIR